MQISKSSAPYISGLKRARMQSFPGAFEEQLLRLFAGRSAFLRDQLECFGEDATNGALQLPEGIGSLWLDCILTPPPDLKKLDDETIAACLTVYVLHSVPFCCAPFLALGPGVLCLGGPAECSSATTSARQQHAL